MSLSVFVGPLFDAGHCKALLVAGTFLVTFGFIMTSISTQYWHIILAQGICIGLGTCCLQIPSIAVVPKYFVKRRARAMALATVGSSLGATLYPLIFQGLQPRIGFGWTVRIMGFISLVMCSFSLMVIRPRQSLPTTTPAKKTFSARRFIDRTALKDPIFIVYTIAIFFSNVAYFEPIFYLQSYALAHGMRNEDLAKYLLSILNASSVPGRIVPSFMADKIGSLKTYIIISTFSGASILYWISVTNRAGNIAFSALYGFFSGGVVSLAPVVLTHITPDLNMLGTRLGMVSVLKGIGSLIGPPISGALLGASEDYLGLQLFAGLSLMVTALFSILLYLMLRRGGGDSLK
ncbi:Major facilitator superfamily [Macrophomina phaseolina MS6]|uniref:Major facilitator superfamily n=1 Tax=Macrophomina phaseolina (strain MS6) TaxID=1126212 RepID=K2S0C2_MACPH|nr:Major facilitator superfamily [Macrophomina phaseolina MS6]